MNLRQSRIGQAVWAAALVTSGLAPGCAYAGPAPAAQTPSAATPSLQGSFNAATELADSGQCDKALPLFAALAVDPRVKPGSLPAAAIAVRRGRCLLRADTEAQGLALILSGLPTLEAAGASFADEVAITQLVMGQIAFRNYDRDTAVGWYTRAIAAASDRGTRLQSMMRLAQAHLFDGDGAAITVVDKALAEITGTSRDDKQARANFLAVRGRALMNLGRDKEAADDLRRALALSGGLTNTISLSDAALRADLAQAMLLIGDRDKAREYLAYTGAGRISDSPFATASFMGVPRCTDEPGLRPEDSAVVEFAIGDDGEVVSAQTVYSRGSFAAATAFAREVRDWAWKPEELAKLPVFYRRLTRVELHCSTARDGAGGVLTPLLDRFTAWAEPIAELGAADKQAPIILGDAVPPSEANSAQVFRKVAVKRLHALGAERAASGDKRTAGAALGLAAIYGQAAMGGGPLQDNAKATALLGEADPQGADRGIAAAIAALRAIAALDLRDIKKSSLKVDKKLAEARLRAALTDPLIAADPLAQNTVRAFLGTFWQEGATVPDQVALLREVADDTRLEEGHPLRQIALLRLASLAAAAKQYQEAQALFTRTGLTEQQCALIGDIPRLKSTGSDSSDYPQEAQRMGFEGWVKVEYDIDAAGRTANQRALIAYPPFVFVDAAKNLMRGVRYDPTYRPSGQLACSATKNTIKFSIP
ncbi:MAG: energy transducer TonB [Novosphingobium sp.]